MKNKDFVGFDLCVLASSDHTLITYGSFGLWGAILSPGDVIAAKGTNNQTYSVVINNYIVCLFFVLCYISLVSSKKVGFVFILFQGVFRSVFRKFVKYYLDSY